jgi:hypothetical protein
LLVGAPARARFPASGGVSTIELAVVIAVTLLMAALALSAYRTYSAREEVRAGLAAVGHVQALVKETFERTGMPPVSAHDVPALAGHAPRHRYIETLAIDHGRIAIRFAEDSGEGLRGQSLYITPFQTMDGEVLWLCGNRRPEVGLYPLGLFAGAQPPPEVPTTVEPRYLPSECR